MRQPHRSEPPATRSSSHLLLHTLARHQLVRHVVIRRHRLPAQQRQPKVDQARPILCPPHATPSRSAEIPSSASPQSPPRCNPAPQSRHASRASAPPPHPPRPAHCCPSPPQSECACPSDAAPENRQTSFLLLSRMPRPSMRTNDSTGISGSACSHTLKRPRDPALHQLARLRQDQARSPSPPCLPVRDRMRRQRLPRLHAHPVVIHAKVRRMRMRNVDRNQRNLRRRNLVPDHRRNLLLHLELNHQVHLLADELLRIPQRGRPRRSSCPAPADRPPPQPPPPSGSPSPLPKTASPRSARANPKRSFFGRVTCR